MLRHRDCLTGSARDRGALAPPHCQHPVLNAQPTHRCGQAFVVGEHDHLALARGVSRARAPALPPSPGPSPARGRRSPGSRTGLSGSTARARKRLSESAFNSPWLITASAAPSWPSMLVARLRRRLSSIGPSAPDRPARRCCPGPAASSCAAPAGRWAGSARRECRLLHQPASLQPPGPRQPASPPVARAGRTAASPATAGASGRQRFSRRSSSARACSRSWFQGGTHTPAPRSISRPATSSSPRALSVSVDSLGVKSPTPSHTSTDDRVVLFWRRAPNGLPIARRSLANPAHH